MFNPTQLVIDHFIEGLRENYLRTYGILEPQFPNMIAFMGRMALENIANSDAAYHDVEHTIMVTQVGQEILRGKHLRDGRVSPRDWLNFTVGLLCHDIGYVRGVLNGDRPNHYVINDDDQTVFLPPGAIDASLAEHRVNRSKLFVKQRFDVRLRRALQLGSGRKERLPGHRCGEPLGAQLLDVQALGRQHL